MPIVRAILREDDIRPNGAADKESQFANLFLAGLVVLARGLNPFPYRTRPLNPSAPMVLSLKAWKSRSLPGLPRTDLLSFTMIDSESPPRGNPRRAFCLAF